MTISVDDVCTHANLCDEVGGTGVLEPILPAGWEGEATSANRTLSVRTAALNEVLRALERRVPPIREADLSDVTELRTAVTYNALSRLYAMAMSSADSPFGLRYKDFQQRYRDEITGMQPAVASGAATANTFSISMERR